MNCIKSQNQCINSIVFPGGMARSSYDSETFINGRYLKMLYIPFKHKPCTNFSYLKAAPTFIPVILAMNKYNKANLFCIHFHGNACDIAQIAMCAEREAAAYGAHYLIVEYPRFGISDGHPNEMVLNEIAKVVHDFVIHELRVNYKNVVLIGRSIGTGPCCSLASYLETINMPVAAVILQSPYTSLVDVTADLLGCVSFFMLDRFPNWKLLVGTDKHVIRSPVLFIHADNDKVIDCNHSRLMHAERLKCDLTSELFIQISNERQIKGHNYFDYEKDMVTPAKEFLMKQVQSKMTPLSPTSPSSPPSNGESDGLITLPMEVITKFSLVPEEYKLHSPVVNNLTNIVSSDNQPNGHTKDGHRGLAEADDSMKSAPRRQAMSRSTASPSHCNSSSLAEIKGNKSGKCTYEVWCYWWMCPCTFTAECCCAIHTNCLTSAYRAITNSQPVFDYRALKPEGSHVGSLYNVLFRRQAFNKQVNEEDAAKQTEKLRQQHLAGRQRSGSIKLRSGGHIHQKDVSGGEVNNPLFSGYSKDKEDEEKAKSKSNTGTFGRMKKGGAESPSKASLLRPKRSNSDDIESLHDLNSLESRHSVLEGERTMKMNLPTGSVVRNNRGEIIATKSNGLTVETDYHQQQQHSYGSTESNPISPRLRSESVDVDGSSVLYASSDEAVDALNYIPG